MICMNDIHAIADPHYIEAFTHREWLSVNYLWGVKKTTTRFSDLRIGMTYFDIVFSGHLFEFNSLMIMSIFLYAR